MNISADVLGDALKAVEQAEAGRRCDPSKPLMCRLDGKAFHTFTRGLERPYDERLSRLMVDTTKYLVEKTNAKLGYTQSDEITLAWWNDPSKSESEYMFDGKFQKMTSVIASMAGGFFCRELPKRIPEKAEALPCFDARVWNVDSRDDVFKNFVWRQDDCIKNSISMAAQAHFSAKELHGVGSEQKKRMLSELGQPWQQMPRFFKFGTMVRRVVREVELTKEQLSKIPEKHRPEPGSKVLRTFVEDLPIGYLKNESDEVLFELFKVMRLEVVYS